MNKTTTLFVHHTFFLYISLPTLHDYDVKVPIIFFLGHNSTSNDEFFFSF